MLCLPIIIFVYSDKNYDGTLDSLQYCKCVLTPDCNPHQDSAVSNLSVNSPLSDTNMKTDIIIICNIFSEPAALAGFCAATKNP